MEGKEVFFLPCLTSPFSYLEAEPVPVTTAPLQRSHGAASGPGQAGKTGHQTEGRRLQDVHGNPGKFSTCRGILYKAIWKGKMLTESR